MTFYRLPAFAQGVVYPFPKNHERAGREDSEQTTQGGATVGRASGGNDAASGGYQERVGDTVAGFG